jgi:hypothetical protein
VFITDGPRRPKKRNLNIQYKNNDEETELLKEMLENLGVLWHRAPAEAEAECANLQMLGSVDAVWTEASDALMFGAAIVIRFCFKPQGGKPKKKDNLKIRVYRSEGILAKSPCLDQEGLVSFAVLSGAEYNTVGLSNVGPGYYRSCQTTPRSYPLPSVPKGEFGLLAGATANGSDSERKQSPRPSAVSECGSCQVVQRASSLGISDPPKTPTAVVEQVFSSQRPMEIPV